MFLPLKNTLMHFIIKRTCEFYRWKCTKKTSTKHSSIEHIKHIKHVDKFLQILKNNQLYVKGAKFSFGKQEVEYLGLYCFT